MWIWTVKKVSKRYEWKRGKYAQQDTNLNMTCQSVSETQIIRDMGLENECLHKLKVWELRKGMT